MGNINLGKHHLRTDLIIENNEVICEDDYVSSLPFKRKELVKLYSKGLHKVSSLIKTGDEFFNSNGFENYKEYAKIIEELTKLD